MSRRGNPAKKLKAADGSSTSYDGRRFDSTETLLVTAMKPQRTYKGLMRKYYPDNANKRYAAFFGVPYAQIPKGLARYQAPESIPDTDTLSSDEPIDTTTDRDSMCSQFVSPNFPGSSDCLYLNIFVPRNPKYIDELLPVLVFFHGGRFSRGCNDKDMYTPDSILKYGVIFVTINYRLGIYGFLNTHSADCPGNAGLKDQVKALEWIRDNIEHFKGDPKNVTISGSDAGGTCVNLHLIAPASKGLFHKAIIQSGGIYSSCGYKGYQRKMSEILFKDSKFRELFYAEQESKELHECAFNLIICYLRLQKPQSIFPCFGPTVETFDSGAPFIPSVIGEMMEKVEHDIPVMAGITKAEGCHVFIIPRGEDYTDCIDHHGLFRQVLIDNFRLHPHEVDNKLICDIRDRYNFPSSFFEADKKRNFAKFARDIYFRHFYDNFKFGPNKTMHKNLYIYRFDHFSEISIMKRAEKGDFFDEATHGDDNIYLYCPNPIKEKFGPYIYNGRKQNKEIQSVMNHMCSLWANFCKTGIPESDFAPHINWERHTEEKPCYLNISKDLTLIRESLFFNEWSWLNARLMSQSRRTGPEPPDEDDL